MPIYNLIYGIQTAPTPTGYQEVEYIYSDGNQYIDTGFSPNNNSRYIVDYQGDSTIIGPIGCYNPNDGYGYLINGGVTTTMYSHYYTSSQAYSGNDVRNRTLADFNKNILYINGNVANTYTVHTFQTSINAWLFCWNRNGQQSNNAGVKIWSAKIYDNGTIVRDFMPCYRRADGVIGLYDNVNDVFYTNAGSGTFTKGPDVN